MKLADSSICSACFQQEPSKVHVDFEVAWDGPTFKEGIMGEGGEVSNFVRSQIDDLVLCETCVAAALRLLPDPRDGEVEAAEKRVSVAEEALGKQVVLSASLADALDLKREANAVLEALGFEIADELTVGSVVVEEKGGRRRRRGA